MKQQEEVDSNSFWASKMNETKRNESHDDVTSSKKTSRANFKRFWSNIESESGEKKLELGSDGGASGRATALCLSEPGSYPTIDLAFWKCYQSILAGRLAISKERDLKQYILFRIIQTL